MTQDRWERAKEICDRALAYGHEERSAYVARACGGDALLREQVVSLLERRADESAGATKIFPDRTVDLRDRRRGATPRESSRTPRSLKKLCTRCNSRFDTGMVVCPADGLETGLLPDPVALAGMG